MVKMVNSVLCKFWCKQRGKKVQGLNSTLDLPRLPWRWASESAFESTDPGTQLFAGDALCRGGLDKHMSRSLTDSGTVCA